MNEFTKEELETILDTIDHDMSIFPRADNEFNRNICKKITSMIDSYCEHEKMAFIGDVYGYSCKKCTKTFTDKNIDSERHYKIISGNE